MVFNIHSVVNLSTYDFRYDIFYSRMKLILFVALVICSGCLGKSSIQPLQNTQSTANETAAGQSGVGKHEQ